MHEKTFYSCDICGTDYAKKEDAEECEQNHKLLSEAEIVPIYRIRSLRKDGAPEKIRVKFKGDRDYVDYYHQT